LTNGEKFAEVFGFLPSRGCISPIDFDCGEGDCNYCPYYKWADKIYKGRRDEDGEAEYCAKFPSARAE
jgi:hypothetical protein